MVTLSAVQGKGISAVRSTAQLWTLTPRHQKARHPSHAAVSAETHGWPACQRTSGRGMLSLLRHRAHIKIQGAEAEQTETVEELEEQLMLLSVTVLVPSGDSSICDDFWETEQN